MKRLLGVYLAVVTAAVAGIGCGAGWGQTQPTGRPPIAPGEQAPRADPGQRNFGGMAPGAGMGMGGGARRGGMPGGTMPARGGGPGGTMPARGGGPGGAMPGRGAAGGGAVTLEAMSMSDPFVFVDEKSKTYYLTGSGGRMYKSADLKTWTSVPGQMTDLTGTWMQGNFVAAPEIHKIGDKYYYAGTYSDHSHLIQQVPRRYNVPRNQTQLLVSDTVEGPYKPLVVDKEFCLGPEDWDIIDGTLYQEDGVTYMVMVHEWTQLIDGTMAYMPLAKDLTHRTAEPTTIFRASEAAWSKEMNSIGEATFGLKMPGWVTDGPQMFRTKTGKLGMLWSSWGVQRYAQGVAYSTSGSIKGPWVQEKEAFKGDNSGHGMLFKTFEGKLLFIVHHAEGDSGARKPELYEVDDSGDKLVLGKRYMP
jgi:hypothetical protein